MRDQRRGAGRPYSLYSTILWDPLNRVGLLTEPSEDKVVDSGSRQTQPRENSLSVCAWLFQVSRPSFRKRRDYPQRGETCVRQQVDMEDLYVHNLE